MHYILLFISIIFITNSCSAMSSHPNPPGSSAVENIEINLFDGTEFRETIKKDKESRLEHNITKRLYGLFFITKTGFHPEYILFRSTEEPIELNTVPLDRIKDPASGILTGIVFSSVSNIGKTFVKAAIIFNEFLVYPAIIDDFRADSICHRKIGLWIK